MWILMMWWSQGGWNIGDWLAMSFVMVSFWGLLIALVRWLVRGEDEFATWRQVLPSAGHRASST